MTELSPLWSNETGSLCRCQPEASCAAMMQPLTVLVPKHTKSGDAQGSFTETSLEQELVLELVSANAAHGSNNSLGSSTTLPLSLHVFNGEECEFLLCNTWQRMCADLAETLPVWTVSHGIW